MKLTRRRLMTGAGATVLVAGGAGIYGAAPGGVRDFSLRVIAEFYGPQVAGEPAARDFAAAYEAFVLEKGFPGLALNGVTRLRLERVPPLDRPVAAIETSIIEKFATSTNVIQAHETGAELRFSGIFQPFHSPCANQLSSLALTV